MPSTAARAKQQDRRPRRATPVAALARYGPTRARVTLGRGWLALLEGRYREGRGFAQRAIGAYEALGMRLLAAASRQCLAEMELGDGNVAAARALLLEADALVAGLDERSYRSTIQATLADLEVLLGDHVAARAAIDLCDSLSAPEDVINYAITHGIRARLALADGDAGAAERWARSAVHYAFLTDFPQTQASARLELARLLNSIGRPDQATAEAQAALELFAAKGDRPGTDQANAVLHELSERG